MFPQACGTDAMREGCIWNALYKISKNAKTAGVMPAVSAKEKRKGKMKN